MGIINPEDFIQQVLHKLAPAFIYHLVMIESCPPEVNLSQIAQISAVRTELVILPKAYKDFKNVFLTKNAGQLLPHKDHDHAINLVDGK